MSTENNDTNKAKFFGLYHGQNVAFDKIHNEIFEVSSITYSYIDDTFLSLRPISILTDEEISNIANYYGWTNDNTQFSERLLQFRVDLPCICDKNYAHRHMPFVYDYLRSIAILIPWMDLSVEAILSYGWAKIKED